jgi:hypothetical protein
MAFESAVDSGETLGFAVVLMQHVLTNSAATPLAAAETIGGDKVCLCTILRCVTDTVFYGRFVVY